MNKFLSVFCICIIPAMLSAMAPNPIAQRLADTLFEAIDTLEKELPKATQEPEVVGGRIELTKRDAKNRFDRAVASVRKAIADNPDLITQLGTIKKNNESLIDRALRFEKSDTVLASKGVLVHPPSDMFYVLQRIMTTVLPDKSVYDSIVGHAHGIAKALGINSQQTINLLRPVLAGLDSLQTQWSQRSSDVTQKIFENTRKLGDLLTSKDGTSADAQDVAQKMLGDAFARDDAAIAAIIGPWVLGALSINSIPWERLSGEKVKKFLVEQNIVIPQIVPDREYGGRVGNSLAAIILRNYAERREAQRIHGFEDDPVFAKRYRDFVVSFVQDPSQKVAPLLDDKGNFINPLVYAIQSEDGELLKVLLAKNPRLGEIGAEGKYEKRDGELHLKRASNLYDLVKNPEFISVMANAGVKLPDASSLPMIPQNPIQERIAGERVPQTLRQFAEGLFALSLV